MEGNKRAKCGKKASLRNRLRAQLDEKRTNTSLEGGLGETKPIFAEKRKE